MVIETLKHSAAISACQELAALVTQHTDGKGNGAHQTAISQLEFMRESSASTAICGVSEPILAIVVQGKRSALLGEETYQYGAAQYLVVSVDLPLSGFVVEATTDKLFGIQAKLRPAQRDVPKFDPGKKKLSERFVC